MTDIDRQRIGELVALLGEERLLALGAQLSAALTNLETLAPGELPEMLHRLSGSAASLGFPAIAAQLAAAETGPRDIAALARQAAAIGPGLAAGIHGSSRQR